MNFVTKFSQKGYFRSKKEINENHHRILNIRIRLGFKFQLEQKILIFWNNFPKKEYFQSKTEKLNISIGLFIFKLVKVPNFSLNRQTWIFGPNLPKKGFSSLKQIKCCKSFTNNGTDIVTENAEISIILSFYRMYTIAWSKIQNFSANLKNISRGKRQFQDVLLKQT